MAPSGGIDPRVGLCARCVHAKHVRSPNGPIYVLCRLAAKDTRFRKYPYTPVMECAGFEEDQAQ